MIGGLQGNWALVLVSYAGLLVLAIAAHVVWAWRIGGGIWRSGRSLPSKLTLMALVAATPVVGFYAVRVLGQSRHPSVRFGTSVPGLIMPAIGLCAVLVSALRETWRYSPEFRTLPTVLGFIPGLLAFYVAMQLILFMAATVFGVSRSRFLTSRTHLVSAAVLLSMAAFMR